MNKTILVVDDDADARNVLKTLLEREGFEIVQAGDGYDAVRETVKRQPDLIIMDMAMPLMDGVNAVRTIRHTEGFSDVPIICLTAFQDFYEPRALDAGCNDVIFKPLDHQELKELVNTHIG